MIKFFRHIRQNLIMEHKTSKYLKYAIGEIILVVIGILIALQINNWNQKQIIKDHNNVILKNLISEFKSNKIELDSSITNISNVINALDSLLILMNENKPKIEQNDFEVLLEKTFVTPSWTPSSYVLEEMKSSGDLSNIENNELKQLLFKWERDFSAMESIEVGYDRFAKAYIDFISKNGSVRNLDAIGGNIPGLKKSILGKNDLTLLKSLEFENTVDNFYFLAYALRKKYQELQKNTDSIIVLTKKQIDD